ncbi:MAG: STAS domain-containing protein [Armatimonadetes bacterium]|nr:STAS domain-containing protein [Armatimonadota bacterium]
MEVTPFEASVSWEDKRATVHLHGELDFATAPVLAQVLREVLEQGAQHLLLDFHEVTFFDSEGLKVLLQAYRHLREREGTITVQGCSRFVARTFEILGLEAQFGICEPSDER